MKTKKIKIELLSDTCVSDGGIYNSAIDTDICYDDFGFPYIPGKRIKGCLRECALELNDWGAKISIERLFGKQGNKKGQVVIKNAYMKDKNAMVKVIQNFPDTPLFHSQNILECHSYVRTQTSIDFETGVADEQSLRTIRVANKGLQFEADVIFLSEDIELERDLEKCLAVFRHIGISRTRGLGEVKAVLESPKGKPDKSDKVKNEKYMEGSNKLYYEIFLQEPIVCKSVGEQEAVSMDYVEGAKILGLIGQRLKDEGNQKKFLEWLQENRITCSNAYPMVGENRLYEVPASVFEVKNDKINYRNKVYMEKSTDSCDKGLQLNQAKHRYVHMTEEGEMICYSVKMENRYHHSRPEDKSIGRVLEGADGSQFYQISSIKEGQIFGGFIEGDSIVISKVYELLAKNAQCLLGYGQSGEYGACSIRVSGFAAEDFDDKKIETKSFYVLLKSPAIIYNDRAMYSTDVNDLSAEILAAVLNDDFDGRQSELLNDIEIAKYINITSVGGYNVTWGCRKPTISAFDKGTVLVFHMGMPWKIKTGQFWVGERCMEGFGEAVVCPLSDAGVYQGKVVEKIDSNEDKDNKETEKDGKQIIMNFSQEKFVQKIFNRCFKEFLRFQASEDAANMKKEEIKLDQFDVALKPTVSNMMLMCRENKQKKDKSVEKIWKNCEGRFSKKAIGKDRKLDCAKRIIKYVTGTEQKKEDIDFVNSSLIPKLAKEFEKEYSVEGIYHESNKEEWEFVYLEEFLTQIKYVLRQEEKSEVVTDEK